MGLLTLGEENPFCSENLEGVSPFVLLCEHASNRIPHRLGDLGLSRQELTRHIAWDIGALGVAKRLSALLDAPLMFQRYSRLVYDCNRPPEAPSAIPLISEETVIPGNHHLSPADKMERISSIYRPFHTQVAAFLDWRACKGITSQIVSLHSFTPLFKGVSRAVELGLLYEHDSRMAKALFPHFSGFDVRFNAPYGTQDGVMHSLTLHGQARHLSAVLIEIRNDLIAEEAGQDIWAKLLAVGLKRSI